MERDDLTAAAVRYEDLVPPPAPADVRRTALVGVGLAATAVAVGVGASALGGDAPWLLDTARLWLVGLGAVAAGAAVARRPGLPSAWALAAVTLLLGAVGGVPAHWDSVRLMLRVLTAVAAAGAGLAALSPAWRLRAASALLAFHFVGIFLATTNPSPTPGLTEQVFNRVYMPYLQFVYLRNAYHFYSPEPGPASLLAFLVKTKAGEREVMGVKKDAFERRWIVMPKRPGDVKDPLGVSYFRRLSLTEQTAPSAPGFSASAFEGNEIRQRRQMATYEEADGLAGIIPAHPFEAADSQYRLPALTTMRYVLPSYTRHVFAEYVPDADIERTTVGVYRLEHRTMSVSDALRGVDPFSPPSYRAYYLGEYDVSGALTNPRDPMLYWLVPVYARGGAGATDHSVAACEDYLSRHAGLTFDWSSLR